MLQELRPSLKVKNHRQQPRMYVKFSLFFDLYKNYAKVLVQRDNYSLLFIISNAINVNFFSNQTNRP